MAGDTTTHNYGWIKPELHSSPVDWGNKINGDLDLIDAKVFTLNQGVTEKNQLVLNKKTVAAGNPIWGQLNGVARWVLELGDGTAEGAQNTGSYFTVARYTNAGAYIDTVFSLDRNTGNATFAHALTCGASVVATANLNINGGPNAVLNLCDSTGAGKGAVYWEAAGGTVVLSKTGGAALSLGPSSIYLSMATSVAGALTATGNIGCKGTASITAASASDNAYTGFFNSGGARQGYCGWLNSGTVALVKDGSTSIQLTSGIALNGAVTGSGAATFSGTLTAGNLSTSGTIFAAGAATINGLLTVGNLSSAGTIYSAGAATFGGTLSVTGAVTVSTAGISYGGGPAINFSQSNGILNTFSGSKAVITSFFISGNQWAGLDLALNVNGNAYFNVGTVGSFDHQVAWATTASDRKLKSNIQKSAVDALALISDLNVVSCDAKTFTGGNAYPWDCALIADEVQKVIPRAFIPAMDEEKGYAGLNPLPLVTTLVLAVQQLTARVAELEAKLRVH